jgi:hypothetical protein
MRESTVRVNAAERARVRGVFWRDVAMLAFVLVCFFAGAYGACGVRF